ncbi:hypothetical protein D3C81_285700 [compost metagenome]|uniref:Uncharacterized protein n=1 Tax=Paenibacillus stellifer TaxID=169760 RepID=A0A089LRJ9_9BACL|nr:hypothetical protein [Paenibacillus stellifer]AIQ62725.1 hypothetical protein PSTEL_06030 [Paenibacillus stellifer]
MESYDIKRDEWGFPGIPGEVVQWEELTAAERDDDVLPGTDMLDPDRTLGAPPDDYEPDME